MRPLLRWVVIVPMLWLASACTAPPSRADETRPPAEAARASSFSHDRLRRLDSVVQSYVDEDRIAGAVILVLEHGQPVYERAFGWRDREGGVRMTNDTLFRIASQTKAITSAAALMLVEEGRLTLNEPVSRRIAEFAKTTVAVKTDDGVRVDPAKRQITVRDLLTHTAGISYGTQPHIAQQYEAKGLGPAAGNGWYFADKNEPLCASIERLATVPFVAQPGEAWVYGYSTDILGCVVERAAGMSLDEFFRTRIFEPLGMRATWFFAPERERERLATVYASGADGKAVRAPDGAKGQGHYIDGPRKSFSGGAGLISTTHDYARFLEMIRRGGELDGVRLLSPRSTLLMHTNLVGHLDPTDPLGFGFGFQTVERFGANGLEAKNAYGWGGAYSSTYRIDPDAGVVTLVMMQQLPDHTDLREKIANLVHQALQ